MRQSCQVDRCDGSAFARTRLCRACLARLPGELRALLLRHQPGGVLELGELIGSRALAEELAFAWCRAPSCSARSWSSTGFCARCFATLPLELRLRIAENRPGRSEWELRRARRWCRQVRAGVALLELKRRAREAP